MDTLEKRTLVTLAGICLLLGACTTAPSTPKWIYPTTTVNGVTPPGKLQKLTDTSTMLDTKQSDGSRLLVTKGTRLAGTRVGIHVHEYGGHTCVLSGEITDFVEGKANARFPAGTCYYMPADTPMSASNLGTEDAVLIDTFMLPYGVPPITILEPGYDVE